MISNLKLKHLIANEDSSIKFVLKKINLSQQQICFITKNNKLINIITDGDIRRALLRGDKLNDKIKKIKFKRNYIAVKDDCDFLESQKKILKYKVVPIVNKNN